MRTQRTHTLGFLVSEAQDGRVRLVTTRDVCRLKGTAPSHLGP